jgi:hypothetical protein
MVLQNRGKLQPVLIIQVRGVPRFVLNVLEEEGSACNCLFPFLSW